jgi:predicted kinase
MPLRLKIAAISDKFKRPLKLPPSWTTKSRGPDEPYKEFATESVAGPPLLVPEGQRPEDENVARFAPGDEVWVTGSSLDAQGQAGAFALASGRSGDVNKYPLPNPTHTNFNPGNEKAVFFPLGTEGRVHSVGRKSVIVDMTSARGTSALWHLLPDDLGSVQQRGQKDLFVPSRIGDSVEVPLMDIADISIGGADADFWIHRRGPLPALGLPSIEPLQNGFAVKLVRLPYTSRKDIIQQVHKVWETGVFRQLAEGPKGRQTLPQPSVEMIPIRINEYGAEPGNIRPGGRRQTRKPKRLAMKRTSSIRILAAMAKPYQYSTMTDKDFMSHFKEILEEHKRRQTHLTTYGEQVKRLQSSGYQELKLSDVADIRTGLTQADFWIQRNGSEHAVGKPVTTPMKDYFGVILRPDAGISVEDLMAQLHYLWRRGYYRPYAHGTLMLQHVRLKDVANTPIRIEAKQERQAQVRRARMTRKTAASKKMIMMRGVPGSGKSYLAEQLAQIAGQTGSVVLYSTDEFFMVDGRYQFDPSKLGKYHMQNIERAAKAAENGVDTIIIDNTNIRHWEMRAYAQIADKNGYEVEFVESNSPWAKDAVECARRNRHGVPLDKIIQMLQGFEPDPSLESCLTSKAPWET